MNRELQIRIIMMLESNFKIAVPLIGCFSAIYFPHYAGVVFPMLIATQCILLKRAYVDLKWFMESLPTGMRRPPILILLAPEYLAIPFLCFLWVVAHILV